MTSQTQAFTTAAEDISPPSCLLTSPTPSVPAPAETDAEMVSTTDLYAGVCRLNDMTNNFARIEH